MLKSKSINIPFTTITCECGQNLSREFTNVNNFNFTVENNKRNIGVICDECHKFIPVTSFLEKDDILKVMNTFMHTVCNL